MDRARVCDLLKLRAQRLAFGRGSACPFVGRLTVRAELRLQARSLDPSFLALALGCTTVLGGCHQLAAFVGERVGQTLDCLERTSELSRGVRQLSGLTWHAGASLRLKRLDQAALRHRCGATVVSHVTLKFASLDHPLDGSAAHPKRFSCLIYVDRVIGEPNVDLLR